MTDTNQIRTFVPATNLGALSSIAAVAHETTKGGVWWRGQASSEWRLVSHVFREEKLAAREKNLSLRFVTRAFMRHSRCPDVNDVPGWLFLMQHYGLPTRLMDWSESILVAAYFAAVELKEKDGTIWALLPYQLNQDQLGTSSVLLPASPEIKRLFDAAIGQGSVDENKAIAVFPIETDIRMLVQRGAYTIHSSKTPLQEFPPASKFLLRVPVPMAAKPILLQELSNVGIRRSTLFPDLHNLAIELKSSDAEWNL
jgi:hypothetical protein